MAAGQMTTTEISMGLATVCSMATSFGTLHLGGVSILADHKVSWNLYALAISLQAFLDVSVGSSHTESSLSTPELASLKE